MSKIIGWQGEDDWETDWNSRQAANALPVFNHNYEDAVALSTKLRCCGHAVGRRRQSQSGVHQLSTKSLDEAGNSLPIHHRVSVSGQSFSLNRKTRDNFSSKLFKSTSVCFLLSSGNGGTLEWEQQLPLLSNTNTAKLISSIKTRSEKKIIHPQRENKWTTNKHDFVREGNRISES